MEKGTGSGSGSGSGHSGFGTATTKINKKVIRALVVDDSPVERMLNGSILKKVLKIEHHQQAEAEDGKEAVDLHKTGTAHGIKHKLFDLILMDCNMPIMNGIQATKNLREMGISSVIIGVSSYSPSEENTEQKFKEAGANSYVQKPLSANKLKPILEEFNKLIMHDDDDDEED